MTELSAGERKKQRRERAEMRQMLYDQLSTEEKLRMARHKGHEYSKEVRKLKLRLKEEGTAAEVRR